MTEWKEYKLGEIADVQTGPFGSQLHQSDYVDVGIPSIMPVNIGNRMEVSTEKIVYITEEDAERLARYRVQEGDIVYSRRGDVEKCAYIKKKENGWLCGTGCLRIRIDTKMADSKFVAYYLSTDDMKSWVSNNAVGTTMPNLNSSILQQVPLSLPSLDEQYRIASILTSLDDKIDLLRRENATLEAMAETLFRQWFVVEAKEEWEEGKLGDICKYVADKIDITDIERDTYVTTENMCPNKQGVVKPSSIPENIKVTKYLVNDVLLSNIRPYFKKLWLSNRNGGCSNDVLCIRSNNDVFKYFAYYTIRQDEFFDYVMLGSKGCKMPRGDKQHIMNWQIRIPSDFILDNYNEIVGKGIEKIRNNQQQIQTLIQTRDGLLPRLMGGEIKV